MVLRAPRSRRLNRLLAVLVAAASGIVAAGGFAPLRWWPLTILGVALFIATLQRCAPDQGWGLRRGLALGLAYGAGFFGALVGWVGVLGWYVAPLLVIGMSMHTMLFAVVALGVRTLRGWPLWTACAWSLSEFTASRFPFGGFPWGRLAWTSADYPLGGYLPWLGVAGVSFVLAFIAAAIAGRAEALRARPRIAELLAVLVFVGGWGAGALPALQATGQSVTVGMVQGNVDGTAGSGAMGYARSVTNNHLSETIMLMARARTGVDPTPDVVLWPENSTDIDPMIDDDTQSLIQDAQKLAGVPMFIGIVRYGPGPDERQTTALWWDVNGAGQSYNKRNLVPFGEYIPFRDVLLPALPVLEQVGAQGVPGSTPGLTRHTVAGRNITVGDVICFELVYDQTVYDVANGDPQITVVQSNNATYTGTGQPQQQFQITRVRAMEMRREVVVATTSSFSGLIDPKGRVIAQTQEATAAAQSFTIPERQGRTLGVQIGPWVERALALVALGALAAGLATARRHRQPAGR